jgi:hypothetical protein
MESRTEQWGPLEVRIKWEGDNYPDLSYLGKYTGVIPAGGTLYVNRECGLILDACEETQHVFRVLKYEYQAYKWNEDELINELLGDSNRVIDELCDSEYDPDSGLYAFWGYTRTVLAKHLTTMDRNEFRYWVPCNDYLEDEAAFKERDPEGYAEVVAEHGSYLQAAATWTAQDYERHEDYGSQWETMICHAEVFVAGAMVGESCYYTLETDSGKSDVKDVEDTCIHEAKEEAMKAIEHFSQGMAQAAEFVKAEAAAA